MQCSITKTSNDQLFCFVLLICCWNWLTCSHSLLPAISIKIRIFRDTLIRHHLDNISSLLMNFLWILRASKNIEDWRLEKYKWAPNLHKFKDYSSNFLYFFTDLVEESSYGDFHCQIHEILKMLFQMNLTFVHSKNSIKLYFILV